MFIFVEAEEKTVLLIFNVLIISKSIFSPSKQSASNNDFCSLRFFTWRMTVHNVI